MKNTVILILFIHGIVHFTGFVKAFQLVEISLLAQSFSKPIGIIWMLSLLLVLTATFLFYLKKKWWFVIAILAVTISQILIIMHWKEAKFGTFANIIILITALQAYGKIQFNNMVKQESIEILPSSEIKNIPVITEAHLKGLPEIVKKWLRFSGIIGKEKTVTVHLNQVGQMKIKPRKSWMPFIATQYINVTNPAFIWKTNVNFMPVFKLLGRDKFTNGEGEMLINLTSLIPIVNEAHNEKINQAAMIRYLAEMMWFPSAALENYIKWVTINETSAMALFKLNGKITSGVFKFSEKGAIKSFEAERYIGIEEDDDLEKWFIKVEGYNNFNGFNIPNKCRVIWKLKDGDFNWLNLKITELEYNFKNNELNLIS